MPGDLCQETPACAYNGNGNDREFLDRGVRELADRCYGIIAERLFIKRLRSSIVLILCPRWVSLAANTMFFSASATAWQFKTFTSILLIGLSLLYNRFQ